MSTRGVKIKSHHIKSTYGESKHEQSLFELLIAKIYDGNKDPQTLKLKLFVMIVYIIHIRPAECRLCISWVLIVTSGHGTEEVTSELALFGLSQWTIIHTWVIGYWSNEEDKDF